MQLFIATAVLAAALELAVAQKALSTDYKVAPVDETAGKDAATNRKTTTTSAPVGGGGKTGDDTAAQLHFPSQVVLEPLRSPPELVPGVIQVFNNTRNRVAVEVDSHPTLDEFNKFVEKSEITTGERAKLEEARRKYEESRGQQPDHSVTEKGRPVIEQPPRPPPPPPPPPPVKPEKAPKTPIQIDPASPQKGRRCVEQPQEQPAKAPTSGIGETSGQQPPVHPGGQPKYSGQPRKPKTNKGHLFGDFAKKGRPSNVPAQDSSPLIQPVPPPQREQPVGPPGQDKYSFQPPGQQRKSMPPPAIEPVPMPADPILAVPIAPTAN